MATIQKDLSSKRTRIFLKINELDVATTSIDTNPCPENHGVHQVSYYYWDKKENEICQCLNCPWYFVKSQQPIIPSGLMEVLKK